MILKSKLQKLSLDFNQTSFQTIHAKQYDKRSRFLTIYCTENGQSVPLSDGLTIHIKMLTPDGRAILHTVPIQDDGSLLVELTETMLSHPGKANAEIRIYDTEEEALLSTMSFCVFIEPSVYEDGRIIASDEYNALTQLMENASKNYEYVMENAKKSADAAKESEETAALIEDEVRALKASAAESEQKAKESEEHAYASASSAAEHSDTASAFATVAGQSSQNAQNSAKESSGYAKTAESFAHGGTGTRPGEDMDNAEYYYNQSKTISESFAGALRPMGTVSFANLPSLSDAAEGDMYNVSDLFTTTDDFREGSGFLIPPGANIYKTADAAWDVLAGTPVTGVKGNTEASYRRGNVNLTPEHLGALPAAGGELTGPLIPNGGISHVGADGYIAYLEGLYNNTSGMVTGFLRITLPVSWTNTMMKFVVSIYNYVGNESVDYYISGYNYAGTAQWCACTAVCIGKAGAAHSNLPVRFGHDGSKCAITIGESSTVWNYPQVKVHDLILGFNNGDFSLWKSGWNVAVTTAALPIIHTHYEDTHIAAQKSDEGHTHDERYYTEAEINNKMNLLTCSGASVDVGYTTDGVKKSVANNTRTVMTTITIAKPGFYILSADTNFSQNGTGYRLGTFSSTSNGTSNTGTGVNVPANSSGMTTIQNIYLARTTAANSKIYFAVQQNSGAALNTTTWIGCMPIRCI
ncbi:MAG: BppU family phage baseplate upper protein [Lachnospiraceae bacterium]|nr:BppU family phage baseplate upper protein [Lachnospiraceae bacterium]